MITQRLLTCVIGLLVMALLLFALPMNLLAQNKTPSHVYQESERLLREVILLRESKGISGMPRDPGVQYNKLPLHAYSKALEVLDKINVLQQTNDLSGFVVPRTPLRKITPGDVFSMVNRLRQEIAPIKKAMGVSRSIAEPAFVPGKIPSDVYQNLWVASFALDGLIPALTPSHVYRNGQYMLQELSMISRSLNKSIPGEPAPITARKVTPADVLVESFKNLYKVAKLQRRVGVPPFTPPSFPVGKITPSDPYDATSMLMAELVRVKIKLGINENYDLLSLPEKKSPGNVLTIVNHAGLALEKLVLN